MTEIMPVERPENDGADAALAAGLAGVIDRALVRHRAGETFVYGIHQELSPGVVDKLRERYLASGWSSVSLRAGATGAYMLVLKP